MYACEKNKLCQEVYKNNYNQDGHIIMRDDIRTMDTMLPSLKSTIILIQKQYRNKGVFHRDEIKIIKNTPLSEAKIKSDS